MYFLYVVPSQSPFFLGFSPSAFPMCVYFLGLLNGINQANEQWGSSYWTATFLVEKCNSMTELSDNRCHSFLLFILFRLPCFVKSLLLFRRLVFSSSFLLIKVVTKGRCAIPNWKPKTQKKKRNFQLSMNDASCVSLEHYRLFVVICAKWTRGSGDVVSIYLFESGV